MCALTGVVGRCEYVDGALTDRLVRRHTTAHLSTSAGRRRQSASDWPEVEAGRRPRWTPGARLLWVVFWSILPQVCPRTGRTFGGRDGSSTTPHDVARQPSDVRRGVRACGGSGRTQVRFRVADLRAVFGRGHARVRFDFSGPRVCDVAQASRKVATSKTHKPAPDRRPNARPIS